MTLAMDPVTETYHPEPLEHSGRPDVFCRWCRGIGDVDGDDDLMPCSRCGGSGITPEARRYAPNTVDQQRDVLLDARESELRQREAKRIVAGGQACYAVDLHTLELLDTEEGF